jgi:hypothetical protein
MSYGGTLLTSQGFSIQTGQFLWLAKSLLGILLFGKPLEGINPLPCPTGFLSFSSIEVKMQYLEPFGRVVSPRQG